MTIETIAKLKKNAPRPVSSHQLVEYPLGEIALVQQGYTFSPDYQGQAEGKWLYVKVGDLNAHGNTKYLDRTLNYVDDHVIKAMGAEPFPSGSIVFPRVGAALRNNNKRILRYASLTDDNVIIVTVRDSNSCSSEYLYYWFDFQDLQRFCNDGTVPVINSTNLKRQRVTLPGFEHQQQIARLLSTWDTAIQKTEQLTAAKERATKALMQQVFRDRSYPHHRLSKFTRRVTRKNVEGDGHPLTISGADGLVSQSRYFGKRIAAEKTEHYTLLKRGEFAYNKSYSAGYPLGAIKRLDAHDEGIVSTLYLCFALDEKDAPLSDYFAYFCEAGGFNHQIYQVAQEGARNHGLLNVTADDFFSMSMPVPPRDAQKHVVNVLNTATREMSLLRDQLAALQMQKRGLMQKLLTGQWRLPVPNPADKEPATC